MQLLRWILRPPRAGNDVTDTVTALGAYYVIANGVDVILTVATADLTAGDIDFHAQWMPLTTNGNVVAA